LKVFNAGAWTNLTREGEIYNFLLEKRRFLSPAGTSEEKHINAPNGNDIWPDANINPYLQAVAEQFAEGDIPTFYRRISSRDLLSSRGAFVRRSDKTQVLNQEGNPVLRKMLEGMGKNPNPSVLAKRLADSGIKCSN
jgi:hypothetical protein